MIFVRLTPVRRGRPARREPLPRGSACVCRSRWNSRSTFSEARGGTRGFRASGDRWPRAPERVRTRKRGPGSDDRSRWANHSRALADARTAEAIVPAIEPYDRYPGRRPPGATDVAASRRRPSASQLETVTAIEAIARQDGRRPSNGATGGARPLLLPDALSGSASVDAVVTALLLAACRSAVSASGRDRIDPFVTRSVRACGELRVADRHRCSVLLSSRDRPSLGRGTRCPSASTCRRHCRLSSLRAGQPAGLIDNVPRDCEDTASHRRTARQHPPTVFPRGWPNGSATIRWSADD